MLAFGTNGYQTSLVPIGTMSRPKAKTQPTVLEPTLLDGDEEATRGRILSAAFATFAKLGYSAATTNEIAKRARVSKRELYALVGNKQQMLLACIEKRAGRLGTPSSGIPSLGDATTLALTLEGYGVRFLREVSDPAVIAVFRLAIAEAERTPEVARTLEKIGRGAARSALCELLKHARSSGLIEGDPVGVAEQFTALLWGDRFVSLLMRLAEPPSAKEMKKRARAATNAILRLHARGHQGAVRHQNGQR